MANATMQIKARTANKLRTLLYGIDTTALTDEQKLNLFTAMAANVAEMHKDLNSWKKKRKAKFIVDFKRAERGYTKKKKTPLSKWNEIKDESVLYAQKRKVSDLF
jgi:hypothetical protein